jgi:Ca2+-binding EF-hand superfamily protein
MWSALAAIALVFALSANAWAQRSPTTPGAEANRNAGDGDIPGPIDSLQDLEDTGKMLFKLADSDNDGRISQKEAVDLGNLVAGGFFFRADADGDGKITKEEGQQAREMLLQKRPWLRYVLGKVNEEQKSQGEPTVREAIRSLGGLLDRDDDKALEATEVRQTVQSAVQTLYALADNDRDGALTPNEVNSAILGAAQTIGQAMFQAADKDKSGQLSQDEFLQSLAEPAGAVFAVLDADGDNQLSPREIQSAQRVIISQFEALRVPDPGNSIRSGRTQAPAGTAPNLRAPAGTTPAAPRTIAPPAQPAAAPNR